LYFESSAKAAWSNTSRSSFKLEILQSVPKNANSRGRLVFLASATDLGKSVSSLASHAQKVRGKQRARNPQSARSKNRDFNNKYGKPGSEQVSNSSRVRATTLASGRRVACAAISPNRSSIGRTDRCPNFPDREKRNPRIGG